jgi:hypothetical protein
VSPFAIVDRDRGEGLESVLMILDDQAEAEIIAFELRQRGIRADVIPSPPERRRR